MCKAIETYGEQMALRRAIENALSMIADGQLSLEKIAQYSGLPLEKVKELADKIKGHAVFGYHGTVQA